MWGERGLVATFFADLHLLDEPEAFNAFLGAIEICNPSFPREAESITCIVEPDFSNTGFGHPDAVLRVDSQGGSNVIILEAKRFPFVKSCKPVTLRGIRGSGFNSSLNGQLELDFALALALEQFKPNDRELIEPAWIANTPYSAERGDLVLRKLKNRNVLQDVVCKISGLPLPNYFFLSLTADISNPLSNEDCASFLPELFHPTFGSKNCWSEMKHQFGWTNFSALKQIIEKFFHEESIETDSLFLDSLAINRKNMQGRLAVESSGHEPSLTKSRGVSLIYAPQINPSTFLHFSWKGEGSALRDYSLSSSELPQPERSYRTSDIRRLTERAVPVGKKIPILDVAGLHDKITHLNKELVLE